MSTPHWTHYRLPAQTGYGLLLNCGQCLRVIAPAGEQVADLVAFGRNDTEDRRSAHEAAGVVPG